MSAEYFRPQVVKMLGNHSPEEFVQLPQAQRTKILEKSQVKTLKIPVMVEDSGMDDDDMEHGSVLRQRDLVGDGAVGHQIFAEAVQMYYDRNTFSVDSHWLGEFLSQADEEGGCLKNINVKVWLEHPYDDPSMQDPKDTSRDERLVRAGRADGAEAEEDYDLNFWSPAGQQLPKAVQDLRHLFSLTSLRTLLIEVIGGGAKDGSDLNTQLKVREISRVVKRLMDKFGGSKRVKVEKVVHIGEEWLPGHSITTWWNAPSPFEKEQLMEGSTSFDTVMRIQMEEWTLVHEKVAGPQATRLYLL
ncbi:hypothetical protein H2200_009877 [Cladophialophora chaetospira]|uniref:Uncharacterized protein n=1 Tax=Cladophialophora chaetospira TaxID=386627 RepID=A0AA38X3H8_9EURO|nr:hypothetical protein H2200_009877 [Cladophialophora chaetospira]